MFLDIITFVVIGFYDLILIFVENDFGNIVLSLLNCTIITNGSVEKFYRRYEIIKNGVDTIHK